MIDSFTGEHRFLSNFWPVDIEYLGVIYPSVEHAYQASKTNDPEERKLILQAKTAGIAKRLGKFLIIRPDWDNVKVPIMHHLVWKKFQNKELNDLLQATGDCDLVEGNTWNDTFWGICNGQGKNHLGKILMHERTWNKVND